MMKKRVLIVDDSAYYRNALKNMLSSSPSVEVVGSARNGRDALKLVNTLKPDIILLDLEMPELDGFSFLRILMSQNPLPVIVVSSMSEQENVYRALELGALDFIPKPTRKISPKIYDIKEKLIEKISFLTKDSLAHIKASPLSVKIHQEILTAPKIKKVGERELPSPLGAVVIGASTGGPSALLHVLSRVKNTGLFSIFIAQHIPPGFSKALAERLNRYSEVYVKEAEDGEEVKGGCAYLAPGGKNMLVVNEGNSFFIALGGKMDSRYVPSIDLLMKSVVRSFKDKTLGVLLTGMGNDGVSGLESIIREGGRTVAESQDTAVIYGMPREAVKRGVVNKVVSLYHISDEINSWVKNFLLREKKNSEKI